MDFYNILHLHYLQNLKLSPMKTQQKIHAFFNRSKDVKLEDNVFIPDTEKQRIKIDKTVHPDERLTYNETFEYINKQLIKA